MPVNAVMLVRIKNKVDDELLAKVRIEFLKKFDMEDDDFFAGGPLITLENEDRLMPVKDDASTWINVNFALRYFGEYYKKGNFEFFDICADWLENVFHHCEIWYGSDVNDASITRLDTIQRKKLLDEYRRINPQDIFTRRFR